VDVTLWFQHEIEEQPEKIFLVQVVRIIFTNYLGLRGEKNLPLDTAGSMVVCQLPSQ
jgi:hypothetical protein